MEAPANLEFACIPADDFQKNLLREFKRILRSGGLLLSAS